MKPGRGTTQREPVAAGTFYDADAGRLRAAVVRLLGAVPAQASPARLLLAPHSSHADSGAVAAAAWREVVPPALVVACGPSHHGIGPDLALPRAGAWRTPLGDLPIDAEAAAAVARQDPAFRDDWRAHARDHAIEVQLPFLQVRAEQAGAPPAPRLLALCVRTLDLARLVDAGEALAEGLRTTGRAGVHDVLILVSSDMSHHVSAAAARRADLPLLELVRRVEPEAVHEWAMARGVSACGVGAAVLGLAAARRLGAASGRLLAYACGGDRTGDGSDVVGHAALLVPPKDSAAA